MRTKTMPTHLCNLARGWSGLGRLWRRGRRALAVIFLIWVVTLAPLPWPVTPVMGATYTVDRTDDPSPPATACTAAPNDCSLRGAIIAANTAMGPDTIILQSGRTYTLSLDAMAGDDDQTDSNMEDDLDIAAATTAGTLTIQGNGATIQRSSTLACNLDGSVAAGEFRIFEVLSGGNLTLQNVTVRNGCADGGSFPDNSGGGILNLGTVMLTNSTISGNRARRDSGGIDNFLGTVTLTNSTISGNRAGGDGGGIFNFGGTATITNSTISGNNASFNGGGIRNFSGTVTITNSTISGNRAGFGGGINNSPPSGSTATITLTNSTISGNSAGDDGGGIFNSSVGGTATITLTDSTISGNSAGDDGGGIFNSAAGATVRITLTSSTISGNSAGDDGGGIFNVVASLGTATITLTSSTISGNSANDGGGIYNDQGTVNASFVTIANNSAGASGQGGGIFHVGGTVNIKNSIVGNNTAGDCSGSISSSGGNYDSDGSCFGRSGDAIFLGPLRNNGGPTQTHALLAGDPLDGAADCTDVSNNQVNADQRGSPRPRPMGGECDAGAYEVQNPKMLSISISGSGNGTVTSNPGRINCSTGNTGTCTETYEQNTIVQLTAAAGSGSVFAGWSNNCSGASNTVTVTMNTDKACTATFVQPGTIVIQKTAIEGNGTFGFSGSGGIGSFSITTSSGSGARSFSLAPGTYTVTESTPPTGWAFRNLACQVTGTNSTTSINLNMRRASITLAAGETVTCTFTNTRLGVSLFVLQGNGHCLQVDRNRGTYRFRAADGRVFTGSVRFTQRGSRLAFQTPRGQIPMLGGTIDLSRRTGSAALVIPPRGGQFVITDQNIDDNSLCPP